MENDHGMEYVWVVQEGWGCGGKGFDLGVELLVRYSLVFDLVIWIVFMDVWGKEGL